MMESSELLEAYSSMLLIRRFEEAASKLYRAGNIPGFVHLCIGQEATATGACWPLRTSDVITSTHRGHGHCLAKGIAPEPMMAELFGRETGVCRGRGGSMHIADPTKGVFGANGIVAAGLPISVGAGLAAQLADEQGVVVAMFGDGAVAQGAFHESVNMAAVWDLPVIFFCENNHYAEFSAEADQHRASLADRATGYGVGFEAVDGNNIESVVELMDSVVARVRNGSGPVIVEADTYRFHGHYEGDPERYRSSEETEQSRLRDPLVITRAELETRGVAAETIADVESQVSERIDAAVESARAAPEPAPETLFEFLKADGPAIPEPVPAAGEPIRQMDAVRSALVHEMETDPSVVLAGVDIGAGGNVFGLTRGLQDRWPDRVRDSPISETALMGVAVGAAMAGMRPVVELMYVDFVGVCLDQLLNQMAKLRYMTGGGTTLPLVVRTQFGAGRSSGSQHSQSLEAILAHIPGLTVVMPSTPADTYGLLRAAIRDPNPVIFIENRLLYGSKGPGPEPEHLVPLGKASVIREGTDVTVISMSRILLRCAAVADELAKDGLSVEVIDLRTIAPLDRETVLASVKRTGRVLIVHEAVQEFGVGAELAATIAADSFWDLDAPVARLAGPSTPIPYAPSLEKEWLPGDDQIRAAIVALAAV